MAGIGEFEVCFEPVDLWGFFFLLHNNFTINTTPRGWELLVCFGVLVYTLYVLV